MEKVKVKEPKLNNGRRIVNDLSSMLKQQKVSMKIDWTHNPWANDTWTDSHGK